MEKENVTKVENTAKYKNKLSLKILGGGVLYKYKNK